MATKNRKAKKKGKKKITKKKQTRRDPVKEPARKLATESLGGKTVPSRVFQLQFICSNGADVAYDLDRVELDALLNGDIPFIELQTPGISGVRFVSLMGVIPCAG